MGGGAQPGGSQGRETINALAGAHLGGIPPETKRLFREHLAGKEVGAIAKELNISQSAAYRHMEDVLGRAFAKAGYERTAWLDSILVAANLDCCLSDEGEGERG